MGILKDLNKIDWKEVAKRKRKPRKDTRTEAQKAKDEAVRKRVLEAYNRAKAKKGKKK